VGFQAHLAAEVDDLALQSAALGARLLTHPS
jgi:hypothetical protein